jgi:hypothetical protein
MVNHEAYMRKIEALMHGAMTAQERSDKVLVIVQGWMIEMEEQHDRPFGKIRPALLPAISRDKLADLLGTTKRHNSEGKRGKCMEMHNQGARDVCDMIAGEMLSGSIEE